MLSRRATLVAILCAGALAVLAWPTIAVAADPGVPPGLSRAIAAELGPAAVSAASVSTAGAKLDAGDGRADSDQFGGNVAVSGDTAVVGAANHSPLGNWWAGSAYVFVRRGGAWVRQAELNAADGASTDRFGSSVAISGDTIVVGAQMAHISGHADAGAAYVFKRSGTAWTQQTKLTSSDGTTSDMFGYSAAVDGNTVVVGAIGHDTPTLAWVGSAYIFARTGTTWSQQATLGAGDAGQSDYFGTSVALSGDTALIGADGDSTSAGTSAGSVRVFVRSGETWSEEASLTAGGAAANDHFGCSVAMSGGTAVIGAYGHATAGRTQAGAAYVYAGSGATWSQQTSLTAGDAAVGDWFGWSVSISGDTALIGALYHDTSAGADAGAAYAFTRSGTAWSRQASLTLSPAAATDRFGCSVALFGGGALVGAEYFDTSAGANAGAVGSFVGSGSSWTQEQLLTEGDGAANDLFGWSVAVSGDTAAVGAHNHDTTAGVDAGAVYVFGRRGRVWVPEARLTASDGQAGDWFGWSVGVNGDHIVVGAPSDDTTAGANAGSAYLFERSGTTWTEQGKVYHPNPAASDGFGNAVAISGDRIVVGAHWDDSAQGNDAGSAHVFARGALSWQYEALLTGPGSDTSAEFGASVAIDGDRVVVGSVNANVGAVVDAGCANVFSYSGVLWSPEATLTIPSPGSFDRAGNAVAIDGDRVVVGALQHDTAAGADAGAACVYQRSGSAWSTVATLTAGGAVAGDHFGSSVGLSGDTVAVGAKDASPGGATSAGAAYVFSRSGAVWPQRNKLLAADGKPNDLLGGSVAVDADTVLAGAQEADTEAGVNAGAAYVFGPVPTVTRVSGADRYAVAAEMAKKGWNTDSTWGETTHVVVACGEGGKEADPLAAAGLAGAYDAPVLLVQSTGLPTTTKNALTEMAAAHHGLRVHIVGGTASVPDAVWNKIKAVPFVSGTKDRIAGADRYAVSANIAQRMVGVLGTGAIPGVILVCAQNSNAFYDALAASPAAFAQHLPMLGVKTTSIPTSVKAELNGELSGKDRYLASSTAYIANSVSAGTRLATSSNRYTAATQIATNEIGQHWVTAAETGIAAKLPDALTGGTFMGKRGGVLLFTDSSGTLQSTTGAWITANKASISQGWIFGGTASVPAAQETQFRAKLQ